MRGVTVSSRYRGVSDPAAKWSWRRVGRCLVVLVLIPAVGCETVKQIPTTISNMVDSDAGDACRDQRKALESYQNYFAHDMAVGAAAGIASGALLVLVTRPKNINVAIAEIFSGLVIGAAGGYWAALKQKDADLQARNRQMQSDISADNSQIDGAQKAFNQLLDCRRKQAADLRADVAAGRVSRDDGVKQMAAIRSRFDEDIKLGREINANMADHAASLEYANQQFKPQPYVTERETTVYSDSNLGSAKLTTFKARAVVSGAAVDDKWVKVTLAGKRTGFVQASDVTLQAAEVAKNKKTRHAPPASAKGDPVAEGCFTNLSKRQDFDDSVQVASTNTSGFELSGG